MKIRRRQLLFAGILAGGLFCTGLVVQRAWTAWLNHRVTVWVHSYGGIVGWQPTDGSALRTPKTLESWFGEPVLDDITSVSIDGSPAIRMEEIAMLARLKRLSQVRMGATSFADGHAAVLARSRSIAGLSLESTEVSDEGLAGIAESMPQLEFLHLGESAITGEGLKHLAKLPRLTQLWLVGARIEDADLKGIRGPKSLSELRLGEQITDAGIAEIVRLKQLKRVVFIRSPVTDAGIDNLLSGLPHLEELGLLGTRVSREKRLEIGKAGVRLIDPW